MLTDVDIDNLDIIPNGDAVEEARKLSEFDAKTQPITRDGFHLSLDYGRYLAGLVMYKLLNGELPFVSKNNDENKAFNIRMSGKKLPRIKSLDKKLMVILSRACSFDRQDRYQSASEMRLALERLPYSVVKGEKNISFLENKNDDTIGIYEMEESSVLDIKNAFLLFNIKDIIYNRRMLRKIVGLLTSIVICLFLIVNFVLNRGCDDGYINKNGFCVKGYYYCDDEYTLNDDNKCQKTIESVAATVNYTCKSGYTLSGDICVSNDVKTPEFIYQCADGFTLNGKKCERVESADAVVTYTCPSGYIIAGDQCVTVTNVDATRSGYTCADSSYTLSGSTCKKTIREITKASISYSCDFGGTLNGTVCNYTSSPINNYMWMPSCSQGTYNYMTRKCEYTSPANIVYKCSKGISDGNGSCIYTTTISEEAIAKYSCPSGYTAVGNQCAKTSGKAATPKYICTDDTVLKGSKCYTTISTDAVGMYACPSGYVASGASCYKNDFPSAIKKYMCSRVYTLNGDKCEKYEIVASKAHYEE